MNGNMNGEMNLYKYVNKKSPEEKINYSYSKFGGEEFLNHWEVSRNRLIHNTNKSFNTDLSNYLNTNSGKFFSSWIKDIQDGNLMILKN